MIAPGPIKFLSRDPRKDIWGYIDITQEISLIFIEWFADKDNVNVLVPGPVGVHWLEANLSLMEA